LKKHYNSTFKGNRTKTPITQYSLGSISLVVYEKIFSEKKIEMWKVYGDGTQSDDNSSHDP
jgi:hypothetical protein